ncbi:hypothetical protein F7725_005852 [Dissostichus mawsoni]|uniref:Uncharacterized protein n=1 Tax=Dissostichus mawsoni TaxID=36200 RepID=A0A7J5YVH1_DISMA|nr:hypothetical protein F7725_005852 [Dissostichus mawsoni]
MKREKADLIWRNSWSESTPLFPAYFLFFWLHQYIDSFYEGHQTAITGHQGVPFGERLPRVTDEPDGDGARLGASELHKESYFTRALERKRTVKLKGEKSKYSRNVEIKFKGKRREVLWSNLGGMM